MTDAPRHDPANAMLETLALVALVLLALPLALPLVAVALSGERVATKTVFWRARRAHLVAALVGAALVGAMLAAQIAWVFRYLTSAEIDELLQKAPEIVNGTWPWLVINVLSGTLLLPAAWSWHRRRINKRVQQRRIRDVSLQDRIEVAQKRANDAAAAAAVGVTVDPSNGRITGITRRAVTSPLPLRRGRMAFGLLISATVNSLSAKLADTRKVRDWVDGRHVVLPESANAVRALLIAESGSGKTVLLNGVILCALEQGWPVVMIDAKGDPQDAEDLVAIAHGLGRSGAASGAWNLFSGTAPQITDKLMRLLPVADGANQHYLDEARGVLQAVQNDSPLSGIDDLKERLAQPGKYVRDQFDLQMVNKPIDRQGETSGGRVLQSLAVALRPLEALISPDGWTYSDLQADVTVVSLSPVDDAQARLGDLLLLDLRHFLTTRLAERDKSPIVIVVDEFPQLVTGTSDPGDTAGSLFETARSAGVGLVLASQSPAGLSNDETRRRRALTSGAALIFGRSKDPEDVVKYAGTVMQLEASGSAGGEELRSGRAQHTFVVPPQDVRQASDGAFWIVQGGAIARFRALPNKPAQPAS